MSKAEKTEINMVLLAINRHNPLETAFSIKEPIENIELGFEGIINDTKYKVKVSLKQAILRYFDWFEMVETLDNHDLTKECTILASGE